MRYARGSDGGKQFVFKMVLLGPGRSTSTGRDRSAGPFVSWTADKFGSEGTWLCDFAPVRRRFLFPDRQHLAREQRSLGDALLQGWRQDGRFRSLAARRNA